MLIRDIVDNDGAAVVDAELAGDQPNSSGQASRRPQSLEFRSCRASLPHLGYATLMQRYDNHDFAPPEKFSKTDVGLTHLR